MASSRPTHCASAAPPVAVAQGFVRRYHVLHRRLEFLGLGEAALLLARPYQQPIHQHLAHPALTCAIPATSRVDHMLKNMGALSGPLPDQAMQRRMVGYFEGL